MSTKKDNYMLSNLTFSEEDLQMASEMIDAIEMGLKTKHPKIKFENLLLWWLLCAPADA